MARQVGMIQLRGRLSDLVFYKVDGQYRVRTAGNMNTERFIQDPAFEAARLHGQEYGGVMRSASLLLKALKQAFPHAVDRYAIRRLASVLNKVKNQDPAPRGQRTVLGGLQQAEGRELLQGFPLHPDYTLQLSLSKHLQVDPSTGTVTLPAFDPSKWSVPEGSTHFRLEIAWMGVDFENKEWVVWRSSTEELPLDHVAGSISITLQQPVVGKDNMLILCGLEFLQKENMATNFSYTGILFSSQLLRVL